jgi:glycosyltransferase involved in cell wall biosynthesis
MEGKLHIPFFSIVVPAHNEQAYIEKTLRHLSALVYPKESYEVIVVENGSTDDTYGVASRFPLENMHVMQSSTKGVAQAREEGGRNVSQKSDWIVFLDADTHLAPNFLDDCAAYIALRIPTPSAGAVAVRPERGSLAVEVLFLWRNFLRSYTKEPFGIFLIRTDIFKSLPPIDPAREVGEDVALFREAARTGTTFFFATNAVETSLRRFEKIGWVRMLLYWLVVAPLPALQKHLSYEVVR